MEIIRAKILGFCAGVRRAVLAAEKALDEKQVQNGRVFTLGPLIHNPVALQKLAERNLKILNEGEIESVLQGDTVIIRAHGIPPELEEKIQKTGCNLVNATCPLVTKSQKTAAEYAEQGYAILFAGDKNHGEVIGIEGYARKAAEIAGKELHFSLVKDENELKSEIKKIENGKLKNENLKVALLSQTTFSISVFEKLSEVLKSSFPDAPIDSETSTDDGEKTGSPHAEVKIISSICPATHERQDSLKELCKKVDGVIVIGGRTSANTNRLFKTAENLSKKTVLIETPEEIPEEFFRLEKVGITAGASTPDSTIEEVERKLKNES